MCAFASPGAHRIDPTGMRFCCDTETPHIRVRCLCGTHTHTRARLSRLHFRKYAACQKSHRVTRAHGNRILLCKHTHAHAHTCACDDEWHGVACQRCARHGGTLSPWIEDDEGTDASVPKTWEGEMPHYVFCIILSILMWHVLCRY